MLWESQFFCFLGLFFFTKGLKRSVRVTGRFAPFCTFLLMFQLLPHNQWKGRES